MNVMNKGGDSSIASQLTAIEVISELLVSSTPQDLAEALTTNLREMSGAKTVMVVLHRTEPSPDSLLCVSPILRKALFNPGELNAF